MSLNNVQGNRHQGFNISKSRYLNSLGLVEFVEGRISRSWTSNLPISFGGEFKAEGIGFPSNVSRLVKANSINGYFQTYRFIDALVDQQIIEKKAMLLDFATLTSNRNLLNVNHQDGVLLHVRGGDYSKHLEGIGMLSSDYFNKIVQSFGATNSQIYIVSDDSEEITRNRFSMKFNYRYLDTLTEHPLGILAIISKFKQIVISNSTLSWWGAYFQSEGNVIAPQKWFKGMDDPRDLLRASWLSHDSIWEPKNRE